MLQELFQLFDNIIIPLIAIFVVAFSYKITKQYIRLLRMVSDCRRLAKIYNGEIIKNHLIFPLVFISRKGADILVKFSNETVAVKLINLKPKTTVRFLDDKTVEFIRYRRAIGLQGSQGKLRSYAVMGAKGIDAEPIIRKRTVNFSTVKNVKKVIYLTNEPSEVLVYDSKINNYRVIGDGEVAFSYSIMGYRYIRKWLERNNY